MIDVNCFVGSYPFRHVPHPEADVLERVMAREGIDAAWVGHLPGAFHRDPSAANAELYERLASHRARLHPVPIARADWPGVERELDRAVAEKVPAIRAYPQLWGYTPGSSALVSLAWSCASRNLTMLLTVRFEDVRQRHHLDVAGDLTAAHVRELARAGTGVRLLITAAGRDFIEEVHWGLTPAERALVHWDISWLWGPPSDEFSHLLRTVGADRFTFGSMWPLRLVQAPLANLQLREPDVRDLPLSDPMSWHLRTVSSEASR